jgi:hypothetical protein
MTDADGGSYLGTFENPIIVNGAGDEQYAGCTGYPVDSHVVNWLTVSLFWFKYASVHAAGDLQPMMITTEANQKQ